MILSRDRRYATNVPAIKVPQRWICTQRDWMHGWFDEADELDAATVAALLLEWKARDAGVVDPNH